MRGTLRGAAREYDAAAAAYDRRWAAYNRRSLGLLRPLVAARPVGRVLDVGCGTANLALALGEWGVAVERYVGVDLSPGMLGVARRKLAGRGRFPASVVAGDAGALPLGDAVFDTVVTASALHYWADVPRALREARRVLRPGGRMLLVDWCREFRSVRAMRAWLRVTGRAVERVLTRAELAGAMEDAGFRVERAEAVKVSPVWGLMVVEGVVE